MKKRNEWKRGFTLIELIVVMAVIGILVLLAAPRFIGQTKEATFTKHINNAKVLEDASERYYIDHGKWPRGLDEDVYTAEQVDAYAERIFDITGQELELAEGDYWDIDYNALSAYAKLPDESERANYVLRNPVGKVYYLDGLTEEGEGRLPVDEGSEPSTPANPAERPIPDYYVMATDADFSKDSNGNFRYVGADKYVNIPHVIQGERVTSYKYMFQYTAVEGVVSTNTNVTDMSWMFYINSAPTLDLSMLDTSNVTNMNAMFYGSKSTTLDISNFDTSNATNMGGMFYSSKATSLDLSSFNTSNVTDMSMMFKYCRAATLDLSSFDTTNVTDVSYMFQEAVARVGYVRTTADLTRLNKSSYKPKYLVFTVKQ